MKQILGFPVLDEEEPQVVEPVSAPVDVQYIVNQASQKYNVPVPLINSVIQAESSFRPRVVSPAGAQGYMQLMPGTAKELGVTDPFDPVQNIFGGTNYLSQQLIAFGKPELALAAYNAGPGAVRKYNGIPPYRETQSYVKNVMANYQRGQVPPALAPTPTTAQPTEILGFPVLDAETTEQPVASSATSPDTWEFWEEGLNQFLGNQQQRLGANFNQETETAKYAEVYPPPKQAKQVAPPQTILGFPVLSDESPAPEPSRPAPVSASAPAEPIPWQAMPNYGSTWTGPRPEYSPPPPPKPISVPETKQVYSADVARHIPFVSSDEHYNDLLPGTPFYDQDGNVYLKMHSKAPGPVSGGQEWRKVAPHIGNIEPPETPMDTLWGDATPPRTFAPPPASGISEVEYVADPRAKGITRLFQGVSQMTPDKMLNTITAGLLEAQAAGEVGGGVLGSEADAAAAKAHKEEAKFYRDRSIPDLTQQQMGAIPRGLTQLASSVYPGIAQAMLRGGVPGAIAGAGAGAVVGQPLKGAAIGFKAGTGEHFYLQGVAENYEALKESGIDDEYAKPMSALMGIPYAAVEFVQMKQLAGLMNPLLKKEAAKATAQLAVKNPALYQKFANYMGKYLSVVGKETAEEGIQKGLVESNVAGGLYATGRMKEAAERADQIVPTAIQEMKDVAPSMAMMPVPFAAARAGAQAKAAHDYRRGVEILSGLKDKPLEEQLNTAFGKDKVKPVQTEEERAAGVQPNRYSVDVGLGHTVEVEVSPIEKPTTSEGMAQHLDSVSNEHWNDSAMMEVLNNPQMSLEDKFKQAWAQYPASGGWITLPNGEQSDIVGLIKLVNPKPGMVFNHETIHGALRLFTTDQEFKTVTEAAKRNGAFSEEELVNSILLRGAIESGKAQEKGVLRILNRVDMRIRQFITKMYGGQKSFDQIAQEIFEGDLSSLGQVADPATRNAQLRAMAGQASQAATPKASQGPTLSEEIAAAQRAEMMGEGAGIPPAGPIVMGPDMRMPAQATPVPGPIGQQESDRLFSTFSPKEEPRPGQSGWGNGDMSLRAEEAISEGKQTARMIADQYGLKPQTVRDTLHSREWHHILPEGRKTPVAEYFYSFDPKNDAVDSSKLAEMRAREKGRKTEAIQKRTRTLAAKRLGLRHSVYDGSVSDGEGNYVGSFRPWGFDISTSKNQQAAQQLSDRLGLNKSLADGNYYSEESSRPQQSEVRRGTQNMERVINEHADIPQSMLHPLIGELSFYWGDPGTAKNNFHDGHGVAHIIAARDAQGQDGIEAARHMVRVVAEGQVGNTYHQGTRVNVDLGEATAVLSLDKHGKKETWLLTGWKETAPDGTGESNNRQSYTRQSSDSRTDAGAGANTNIPQPPADVKGEGAGIPPAGPIVMGPDMRMPAQATPVPEKVRREFKKPVERPVQQSLEGLDDGRLFSTITDPDLINQLESGDKIKTYRSMQLIDGKLYPPMSAKVNGQLRKPTEIGVWNQSDEAPHLINKRGKFLLDKGVGSKVEADYNPYLHSKLHPLNDQFSTAIDRNNLVVVEMEVPKSELTSGYHAEKAVLPVGKHPWKKTSVTKHLDESASELVLSRYGKVTRIVPDAEVADKIKNMLGGKNIKIPINTVSPKLQKELSSRGVQFGPISGLKPEVASSMAARNKIGLDDGGLFSTQDYIGPAFEEYRHNAPEAVERLKKEKKGEAIGALYHRDVGDIDLIWGKSNPGEKGYGLAKIIEQHPEVLSNLQPIISSMDIIKQTDKSIILGSDQYGSVVKLDWFGKEKRWLLTAYEKRNAPVSEGTIDVSARPEGPAERQTPQPLGGKLSVSQPPADVKGEGGTLFSTALSRDSIEGVKYTPPEMDNRKSRSIISKVARHFGFTNDPKEAGYVMPDGRMLDLSGKRDGGQPGNRSYDHRDLPEQVDMLDAKNAGLARVDFNFGLVNMSKPLDPRQKAAIIRGMEQVNPDYMIVEADDSKTHSVVYNADMNGDDMQAFQRSLNEAESVMRGERGPERVQYSTARPDLERTEYRQDKRGFWEVTLYLDNGHPWGLTDAIDMEDAQERARILSADLKSVDAKRAMYNLDKVRVPPEKLSGLYSEPKFPKPHYRVQDVGKNFRIEKQPGLSPDRPWIVAERDANERGRHGYVPPGHPQSIDEETLSAMERRGTFKTAKEAEAWIKKHEGTTYYSTASREFSPGDYPESLGRIVNNTNLRFLKTRPDYKVAKGKEEPRDTSITPYQRGESAERVVNEVVKPKAIEGLKALLDPTRPVVIIPVIGHETTAVNMLPMAYAERLAKELGAVVWDEISKVEGAANTNATIRQRSFNEQRFEGIMPPADAQVVVVDDTPTSGDTLTSLIDLLAANNRMPVAASTLAVGSHGLNLSPTQEDIQKLLDKAGMTEVEFEHELGYPTKHITGQEAREYLLKGSRGPAGLRSFFPNRSGERRLSGRSRGDGAAGSPAASREQVTSPPSSDNSGAFDPNNPDIRYSTTNLDSLSQPQRDRYTDAAFAAMYQYGGDEDAYREALRAQFGNKIDPYMDDLREMYLNRRREGLKRAQAAAMQGGEPVGRPDLANFGETPEAKRMLSQTDEARNEAGKPDHIPRDVTREKAEAMIERDREGTIAALLAKGMRGEPLTPEETRAGTILFNELAQEAINSGDLKAHERAQEFADALRESRGAWGRAGVEMQVPKTPEEKANTLLQYAMSPSHKLQAQIDEANRRLKDKMKTGATGAAAEKRRAVLRGQQAKQVQKRLDWLKKLGYDLTPKGLDTILRNEKLLARFMADVSTDRSSLADKAHELRISNMLSWVTTHQRNILSSVAHQALDTYVQRAIEAIINSLPGMGHIDAAQLGEYGPILMRSLQALPGGPLFKTALKNAMRAYAMETQQLYQQVQGETLSDKVFESARLDSWHGPAIKGAKGRAIRTPLRLLLFEDELLKNIYASIEVGAQAHRIAKAEKTSGKKRKERIRELVNDPTSDAWKAAFKTAERLMFQDSTELSVEQGVMKARNIAGGRWVIPFAKTPMAVFRTAVRKAGGAGVALVSDYRKNQPGDMKVRHAAETILAIVGATTLYAMLGGDDDDLPWITGANPRHGSRWAYSTEAYEIPKNAFRVGNTYYDYTNFGPFGDVVSLIVTGIEAMGHVRNADDVPKAATEAWAAFMREFARHPMLTGVNDFITALEDEDQWIRFWQSFAGSFSPNIIKGPVRAMDPVMRDKKDMTMPEGFAYAAYPSGEGMPAKIDVWGREVLKGGSTANRLFNIFRPIKEVAPPESIEGRLNKLIRNWNVSHPDEKYTPRGPVGRSITENGMTYDLTASEFETYRKLSGEQALKTLAKARLNYDIPGERDIQRIKDALANGRELARRQILRDRRRYQ